jgi:hypothetical protein
LAGRDETVEGAGINASQIVLKHRFRHKERLGFRKRKGLFPFFSKHGNNPLKGVERIGLVDRKLSVYPLAVFTRQSK